MHYCFKFAHWSVRQQLNHLSSVQFRRFLRAFLEFPTPSVWGYPGDLLSGIGYLLGNLAYSTWSGTDDKQLKYYTYSAPWKIQVFKIRFPAKWEMQGWRNQLYVFTYLHLIVMQIDSSVWILFPVNGVACFEKCLFIR